MNTRDGTPLHQSVYVAASECSKHHAFSVTNRARWQEMIGSKVERRRAGEMKTHSACTPNLYTGGTRQTREERLGEACVLLTCNCSSMCPFIVPPLTPLPHGGARMAVAAAPPRGGVREGVRLPASAASTKDGEIEPLLSSSICRPRGVVDSTAAQRSRNHGFEPRRGWRNITPNFFY